MQEVASSPQNSAGVEYSTSPQCCSPSYRNLVKAILSLFPKSTPSSNLGPFRFQPLPPSGFTTASVPTVPCIGHAHRASIPLFCFFSCGLSDSSSAPAYLTIPTHTLLTQVTKNHHLLFALPTLSLILPRTRNLTSTPVAGAIIRSISASHFGSVPDFLCRSRANFLGLSRTRAVKIASLGSQSR